MSSCKAVLLIADDEEMNKLILARRLRREGFEIIDVSDGAAAVEKVRTLASERLPEAVLMDINMPVMDGIEAMRIIKEEFEDLPVIAVTAGIINPLDYDQMGFDAFCPKPIDFPDLVGKIERCIAWRHTH